MTNPVSVFGDEVVLELKFDGRFPNWMRELVQVFGLTQCSAAKYVDGLVRMKENPNSHLLPALDTSKRIEQQLRQSQRAMAWL
jgi:hypothetical protein